MTSEQPGQAPARNCVACGRAIAWDANVCPYCGHDFRPAMTGPQQQGDGKKSFKGSLAVLIILIILCWPAGLIYFFIKRDE